VPLVVDVVDLEGELRVAAVGAQDAVGGGPDDDRLLEHGVVHRHDVRAVRGRQSDTSDDSCAQEAETLLGIEIPRLGHVGLP
jgi:hypothetical protein